MGGNRNYAADRCGIVYSCCKVAVNQICVDRLSKKLKITKSKFFLNYDHCVLKFVERMSQYVHDLLDSPLDLLLVSLIFKSEEKLFWSTKLKTSQQSSGSCFRKPAVLSSGV